MVQSGIAYAAGQLLAVVAPRTVLVVDAPTDWSLAGPLWELALDDAPVDEILDVLIRRGIRTAPSFAIVRVEVDAVRALVRGSVPVCFERVGEPVRLDATGATTWLEGLISGARRVLVGAVETNTKLPYLVSTGVVLVSGLALPCGPGEPESRRSSGPDVSEPMPSPESSDSPADEDSFFSAPVPVSSGGSGGSGSGSTTRFAPVAGREPRVVDLTRSESRPPVAPARAFTPAPEPRDSWAMASNRSGSERSGGSSTPELNGHAPTALEPSPLEPSPVESPSAEPESTGERDSLFGGSSVVEARSSGVEASSPFESPSSYRAPAAFQAPAPSAFQAPAPFASAAPSQGAGDDPGELHDLDDPLEDSAAPADEATPVARSESTDIEPAAQIITFPEVGQEMPLSREQLDELRSPQAASAQEHDSDADRDAEVRAGTRSEDSLDDLLIEPADDEAPPGPAPTDLPSFEPPAVALPLPAALNGTGPGLPASPRGFGGAPAGWPPASASATLTPEPPAPSAPGDMFAAPPFGTSPDREARTPEAEPTPEPAQPSAGDLPLRVRGRSLRPEHSAPVESRLLGEPPAGPPPPVRSTTPVRPAAVPPLSSIPPLRSLNDTHFGNPPDRIDRLLSPNGQDATGHDQGGQPPDDGTSSGGLLLPAFFRGSRAARKGPADPPMPPSARENEDEAFPPPDGPSSGPIPWASGSASAPAAWVPPVRRGLPDRSGFNGGPPAMPGVLRPSTPSEGTRAEQEHVEPVTEYIPPSDTPSGGIDVEHGYEPPREPPRLLGVWCDAGHVTSPDNSECRVCGLSVPPQAPILVARPPLGVLIFDNGDRVDIDRPVVLGRDPKPVSSPDPEAPVLHPVSSATGQVSRTHAEIRADGWDVVLTDLDAMNGTALTLPGASPVAIEPGVPTVITPGARVDLGGETGFVFEVEG